MCELEGMPMPDGGVPDGGVNGNSGGGCSVQSRGAPVDLALFLSVIALLLVRRRPSKVRS
jgi:MYXO-CTERM domain-containing protein